MILLVNKINKNKVIVTGQTGGANQTFQRGQLYNKHITYGSIAKIYNIFLVINFKIHVKFSFFKNPQATSTTGPNMKQTYENNELKKKKEGSKQ